MNKFDASPEQIDALVSAYPLAWVVSGIDGEIASTPLPLLAEHDATGEIVALFGHFARSNPQVKMLERAPAATILFQGPQGYVSPRLVDAPKWGATWNYAIARFHVDVAFVPDETRDSVYRLARALEAGPTPWCPDEMAERFDKLLPHIVAFRATVRSSSSKFKLGQDETTETLTQILDRHDDPQLVDWMRRANGTRA